MKRRKVRKVVGWGDKASRLIRLVERRGGVFSLVAGGAVCKNCPSEYVSALRASAYLILAILRDQQASIKWERDYACHCPARPFAHPPHRPHDVWQVLKRLERLSAT